MIWEWESSESVSQVLEGKKTEITCIAVSSDGERILSSSFDGTLRRWDVTLGTQMEEFLQGGFVYRFTLSGNNQMIALWGHF